MAELLAGPLYFLGKHFTSILIVCVVLAVAAALLGRLLRMHRKTPGGMGNVSGDVRLFLRALERQGEEAWVLFRRGDGMPVYAVGNMALPGVSLSRLQEDLACILGQLARPEEGRAFWARYRQWDGQAPLCTHLEKKDGQWMRVSVSRCPDTDYDMFALRQVTEEHEKENTYAQQLQQAENASQFKTSFLFRMSHEIRTPMNGITGTLMLAESRLSPDHPAMQYLSKANELSDHLLSLVNDILDMARIEAGKIELESEPFSLRALGQKLYDMFVKTLDAAGIHYEIKYEELTVDWVLGDELRISQVILNFLSNAVKFTSEGEITVTFRQMLLRDDHVDLMVRVHDTGIGMKPEFIERIFRPFEQEDISTTRRFGGTGLGMTISDHLVKLMGGQIVVDSLPGEGSDFSVFLSLPVAQAPAQEASGVRLESPVPLNGVEHGVNMEAVEELREANQGQTDVGSESSDSVEGPVSDTEVPSCRILMAEDNEINAMITVEILESRGVKVDVEENGQLTVERFASQPEGYYDLILMDIQMPVMDGRTAARTIRGLDRADARVIPIYALSADAFVEDERLSKESGMDGHLTKPIDYDLLWTIIRECTGGKKEEER